MTSTVSDISQNARDYARIEAAILYLEEHFRDQPELGEVAEAAGLGPHHFQRLFRRSAGISPKRFGQYLTLRLRQGSTGRLRLDPRCRL